MKQHFYTVLFLVYLFSYIQISPALQDNYSNYDDSLLEYLDSSEEDPIHIKTPKSEEWNENRIFKRSAEPEIPLSRSKRFAGFVSAVIAGALAGTAANVVSHQINKAVDRAQKESGGSASKQTVIQQTINVNYNTAVEFRNRVARESPEAARAIVVSPYGFTCDSSFCRRYGAGQHSIGICSPQICHCANGIPYQQICGQGTVFDPVYKICNWAYNVKFCGA